ncbi:MAG: arginase [Clostridia bacterium]|jgi:hypothetical protein
MGKTLLSIDWDYFIFSRSQKGLSCIENDRNVIDLWYKRYIESKRYGRSIQKLYSLSSDLDRFWENIRRHFNFDQDVNVYVSDSHVLSYHIAKKSGCREVYLFDAHADLGYGDPLSLDFEVNCANWLGKLFKERHIDKAHIIYSPFTDEKPEYFRWINRCYQVFYPASQELDQGIKVSVIHVSRSGAWTPPWFDKNFTDFVNGLGIPYKTIACRPRKWNTENISFSDQIHYMMS